MLLSGLTTWLSVMTASCSASMVGASASSPGASRFRVSATSASLLERAVARGERVEQAALGEQPVGHAVLGQHPLDQSVVGEQLVDQTARFDGAHQPAVVLRQPVEHAALGGQLVDHATGPQQPVERSVRRQRPPQRLVVVHQLGQPVGPVDGVLETQHLRHRRSAPACSVVDSPSVRWATSSRRLATPRPDVGDGEADPDRCGREIRQGFAEVHSASLWRRHTRALETHRKFTATAAATYPSEWEALSSMAMAALPENVPEARVLVVDDETNIVELLSVSLKFQGFEVHTASNGARCARTRPVRCGPTRSSST